MTVRLPNRVGERGTYSSAGSVALTGVAAQGMRTCAAAVAAGALADGDRVGVALVSAADRNRWAVWTAVYHVATASLVLDSVETVSTTPIADGESVDITLCVTSQTLDWYINGEPLDYFVGPGYWTPEYETDVTWDSVAKEYVPSGSTDGMVLLPAGTWATGYRPTQVSLEIFVPSGANAGYAEYSGIRLSAGATVELAVGASVALGEWNTLTGSLSLSADITMLSLIAGDFYAAADFRFRHILFAE